MPVKQSQARQRGFMPDDDESYEDFMDRCMSEDGNEAACQLAWDERATTRVLHKTHVSPGHGLEFILSDASPDRMGDVIDADGWNLDNFKNNPVALFNHNSNFPIGKWTNLRVVTEPDVELNHFARAVRSFELSFDAR